MKWTRSKDGAIFGVCKGLAKTFEIPVGALRLLWILSVVFLGAGLWLYLIRAVSLPREDKAIEALDPWILGVCSKAAFRTGLEIGIVRFLAICLGIMSLGASIVGYVVLYFVFDDKKNQPSSDKSPTTPPAIT